MKKFTIPPDQASYSFSDGNEIVETQLDGGAARRRRDVLNANSRVNVQWTTDPEGYKYIRAFFKSVTVAGSLPFSIDLYLDEGFLTSHTAAFIKDSLKLDSQRGLTFICSAALDVTPIPPNDEFNNSYVDIYNGFKDIAEAMRVFNRLAILVNIEMPATLY